MYQHYQKSARLQVYLDDVNDLLSNTENLKGGADILSDQFVKAKTAVRDSLSIDQTQYYKEKSVPVELIKSSLNERNIVKSENYK